MTNTRATNKLFCTQLTGWVRNYADIKFAVKGKRLGKYYIIKQNKKGEKAIFIKPVEEVSEPSFLPPSGSGWFYRRLLKKVTGNSFYSRYKC